MVWSENCEEASCKLKIQLAPEPVLAHYDLKLELRLACDGSPYGVGAAAVLSNCMPGGKEKPAR